MSNIMRDTIVEGNPGYIIYFDNIRVDQFVKSFSVNLSVDGSMSTATIDMIYVPDLDKIIHQENQSSISTNSDSSSTTTNTKGNDYGVDSWPSILKKGSSGNSVKQLQQWLLDLGYSEIGSADGLFGTKTSNGVRRFQKDNSCTADGIVGKQTKAALKKKIKSTSSTTANAGSSFIVDDGVENMTNTRIFMKNIFNNKYVQIFEGNIRSKSGGISGGEQSLTFQAVDYMNWLNRTICPIAIPLDDTLTPGDRLRWKAQGIDVTKVKTVTVAKDITFKGKNISQMWKQIADQTITANALYSTPDSVAAWDNVLNRVAVMGDIDENLRNAQIMDFMVSSSVTSVDTIYVLMNDILKTLLFEFYQDRDGVIRIKPPFWNEHVLTNHVIDGSLIVNFSEAVNWNNAYTRIIATGGLDEWEQTDDSDVTRSLLTPVVAYTSNGINGNSGPVVVTSQTGGGGSTSSGDGNSIVQYARSFIGTPYKWGGKTPAGFDCSGLVSYVFKHFGITLPAGSFNQVKSGVAVSVNQLVAGDLLFYGTGSNVHHVTIYSGNGKMIEAYQTGTPVRETTLRTPSSCRRVLNSSAYVEGDGYLSHSTGTSGTPTSVGPDQLLQLTMSEKKYGPLIYDVTQPLIKFSTSSSIDNSGSAYEALQKYAKFMLNFLNSAVSMASMTTIAMPWIRPGFNIWVDPVRIDKIFYVNSINHQGSPSGCYTTLNLTMGRDRTVFVTNPNMPGSLKPGISDDVFINTLKVKPENFGQVCDYAAIKQSSDEFHKSNNPSEINIVKAHTNPYFQKLYVLSVDPTVYTQAQASDSVTASTPSKRVVDFDSWPNLLKKGNSGAKVKELQGVLLDLGYSEVGSADGRFGPKTASAVLRFQKEHKCSADKIVGPKTKNALKQAYGGNSSTSKTDTATGSWRFLIKIGSKGDDVRQLQQLLKDLGYSEVTWVDGSYGPKTSTAVKRFQKEHNCAVDGKVGPQTRAALEKAAANKPASATGYGAYGNVQNFAQEFTADGIKNQLTSMYNDAPNVIKSRSSRLNTIITNSTAILKQMYAINEL